MPLWTSAAVDAPRLAEISPNAISPSRPFVIALVTILALSALVAAIGVVAACVVVVQTIEMTDSLALQLVLSLALAGSLVQISVLSFMFVREKVSTRRNASSAGHALFLERRRRFAHLLRSCSSVW